MTDMSLQEGKTCDRRRSNHQ